MSLRTIVALAALGVLSPAVWAQSYPSKPVRVIVTFPPGGTPDIYGRVMSAELQRIWSQSVVVENRTGAGGTIGTDYVAKAAPDGYTLLFAADASITIAPHLYSKLPYNPVRLIFGGITASIQLTKSGKLKALAVTGPKRAKALPNVPAVAETLPGFDITAWYGFLAPAGTSREIVKKIHDDSVAVIKRPDFLERLDRDGIDPVGNTPEEFAAQIKNDLAHWAKIVKAAGAKLD